MAQFKLQKKDEKLIGSLVDHFSAHIDDFELLLKGLRGHILVDRDLAPCIHSVKWRVKSPDGLRDKLVRKMQEAEGSGKPFGITTANLFKKINDLAGFRILHLHTQQMERINKALLARLSEALYVLREGPIAKTWDDESRDYFSGIGIKTERSKDLYTSVHYVVKANIRTQFTCEIQVRTLAEELWGEVDHSFNYPHPVDSIPCREQIKVLARVTSSCTRLVDSIFRSFEDSMSGPPRVRRRS
ncbi:MAG TPA: RelA/SpoT domain-containing protein [Terriglobia bacterium]|nr:RelA/SpoT domain-containing protein [Terriglobia bacterium]